MDPFISICIPAYKNVFFLKKLLDSIADQSFKSYEVVISDDSPNNDVRQLVSAYEGQFPGLTYLNNTPAKGMPENWNTAIAAAKGRWIKIMHDDDWFADGNSLQLFAAAAERTGAHFIFSDYANHFFDSKREAGCGLAAHRLKRIKKVPLILMAGNLIGPPSVCMVHKSVSARYNPELHWLVDIDYYIQILLRGNLVYHIPKQAICIGVNPEQITQSVKNNPAVEIGEAKILLDRYGQKWLKKPMIYDAWWRLFRNMNITAESQLVKYGGNHWPSSLKKLLVHQNKVPAALLKTGIFSKFFMLLSYISQFKQL